MPSGNCDAAGADDRDFEKPGYYGWPHRALISWILPHLLTVVRIASLLRQKGILPGSLWSNMIANLNAS
jgi:hypothetical protein